MTNSNFVVLSPNWDSPAGPFVDAGAVTWCSGTTGCNGVVSATNSLVGGTANDQVGSSSVTVLTNGNYVVRTPLWDNPAGPVTDAGAATWGNGSGGTTGVLTKNLIHVQFDADGTPHYYLLTDINSPL